MQLLLPWAYFLNPVSLKAAKAATASIVNHTPVACAWAPSTWLTERSDCSKNRTLSPQPWSKHCPLSPLLFEKEHLGAPDLYLLASSTQGKLERKKAKTGPEKSQSIHSKRQQRALSHNKEQDNILCQPWGTTVGIARSSAGRLTHLQQCLQHLFSALCQSLWRFINLDVSDSKEKSTSLQSPGSHIQTIWTHKHPS